MTNETLQVLTETSTFDICYIQIVDYQNQVVCQKYYCVVFFFTNAFCDHVNWLLQCYSVLCTVAQVLRKMKLNNLVL